MARRRSNRREFVIGVALASASLLTAWVMGRPTEAPERVPMETVLETAEPLRAAEWDLPVTHNERVEQWIDFLSGRNADKTRLWLSRSGRYAPMIREQLRARGMPEDLVYLAFIESGFSPRAYSRAAASGIWQFIEETGERYGLEVNSYVDERRDPLKSTRAALDYLQELYDRFGSWYLAAAAYNTGENRVERILRERAGGQRGSDHLFWRIAPHLPSETRNYVPLMLAAGHIGKDPAKYGFTGVEYETPLTFDTAWVPQQSSLELIARAADVDAKLVRDLNPHLLRGVTPPNRAFAVRIPSGTHTVFAAAFPTLLRQEIAQEKARLAVARTEGRKHTIRRGETLSHIARRYDVSVSSLLSANRGVSPRRLVPGRVITVPATGARAKVTLAKASTTNTRLHRVRRGENLSVIADRYDTTVGRLQKLNGLGRRTRILPGQRLRIG
jgi:membrane-bound lytic murein transglycosylase D